MTVREPAISAASFLRRCRAQEREHVPGQLLKADPWAAVHDHVGGHPISPQPGTGILRAAQLKFMRWSWDSARAGAGPRTTAVLLSAHSAQSRPVWPAARWPGAAIVPPG